MPLPGYILLWRQFMETSFFTDSIAVHLAVYLLLEANHKPRNITFNGSELTIYRGQTITGRQKISEALGMNESIVYRKLMLLERTGFCTIKSNNRFSIITICKYEEFQNPKKNGEQLANNKRTTSEQLANTPNELKELKELKNKNICEVEILNFLNQKANRRYKPIDVNLGFISARLKEGNTPAECRQVIAKKVREWGTDEKMKLFLRPSTLFNKEKFSQYVGELVAPKEETIEANTEEMS